MRKIKKAVVCLFSLMLVFTMLSSTVMTVYAEGIDPSTSTSEPIDESQPDVEPEDEPPVNSEPTGNGSVVVQ